MAAKRGPFGQILRFLPVTFIITLAIYAYYIYVTVTAPLLLNTAQQHDKGVRLLIGFHIVYVVWLLCFLLASLSSAGKIPEDWLKDCYPDPKDLSEDEWDAPPTRESRRDRDLRSGRGRDRRDRDRDRRSYYDDEENVQLATVEKKRFGGMRFCRRCDRFKPDRTHHCSNCGHCVLKMDHHCPWIANCVGFNNYKYFLLFLIYTVTLTVYISATLIPLVYSWLKLKSLENFIGAEVHTLILAVLSNVVGVAVLCLLIFHFFLTLNGYTTIELLEKANRAPGGKYHNAYDLGMYRNWTRVMGTNPLVWLIPVRYSVPGQGIFFENNQGIMPDAIKDDFIITNEDEFF